MTIDLTDRARGIITYAINARTRAVGWLTVSAIAWLAYLVATTLLALAMRESSPSLIAVGLIVGGVTSIVGFGALVPAVWLGFRYAQARGALSKEVAA
ncbi:Uncharacterised protein [Mycobacteroides abscessus]|uniref:hypothetical protein n=1 Tax=Mycobacteroides abscessus TaxID=36809 RepID=UPI0005E4024D|nr:hypothetical protein [Mycobacteroides abscessus]CPX20629.1 Uncharacterised protein [Mycobacteroides abscessus]CRG61230.1 Uncharacterised protein [Mycobacteroides abscessus]